MIDSHCHLDAKRFDKDRKTVVESAKAAGVKLIIDPASDFSSNEKIARIAKEFKGYVFPCAGIDPISCLRENRITEIEKYLDDCVALGEIGLDYYWSRDKCAQTLNFERFIGMAKEYEKPLIIHAREAMKDALEILARKHVETAILHCFSGDKSDAKKAEDLGYYISLATNICYGDSKSLIKDISLSNMLVETDSPYLHPERKGRNEPKNVALGIDYIASVKELSAGEIEKITERNTRKAFNL